MAQASACAGWFWQAKSWKLKPLANGLSAVFSKKKPFEHSGSGKR
jgi:hypothetical protein